ncbi:hypothetical protein DSM106972_035540 [Dulcicalothrix desertica PCC 7102]|uniref:Uncharacterized protein n=1 Tax=Dulcicalothrix desertica PCC 7102 TaxID=232991 RepID=A0A3S1CNT4_9CYAN|nr:hypothetical protein [Dulcicalothrix desertica]RUT05547.1 hypothetical protein DSM106972_035540 [Dulcicalothrix desertica PCC 7102]TWH54641.1 hypothetical protein CAL7102_02692 [Dulcicalothrix desertica PCC 7102]
MLQTITKANAMRVCPINSSLLRQFWSVVEDTQTNILLGFSDTELVQQLLRQLQYNGILSTEEITALSIYIDSRLVLIRDLAASR